MTGLLYKDLYILWHAYKKNLLLVAVLYGAMAVALEMSFMLFMLCWVMGFYVIGSISIDNASKWDLYAACLPVSRGQIVGAKFLLTALALAAGCVYGVLISLLLQLINGTPLLESLASIGVVAMICLAYFGVTLVLSYQFGVEKARTTMLLLMAGLAAAFMFALKADLLGPNVLVLSEANLPALMLGLAVISVGIYLICWGISTALYAKKEF